ncbi:anti-sigma regulatory factor (Ser/Thr protein kinase) [Prauserella sediminis]|uniref:histidine kinase n=1 Tax=Prauserella sediminis TaxID=577680 RepID=A0A839XQ63_9PSEU|nr:ATP-binding protein [Prauserella sediminis]MBB3664837.1 anti-sigma regulatory factor (Ser/Thr protein kinase) [Prauserella sediminis]
MLLDRSRVAAAQLLDPPRQDGEGSGGTAIAALAQPLPARGGEQQQALVDMCANLALRDLNLVDTLLQELEKMEIDEEDEERLGQLYRLDHLAARLRRNAENLRVLAGKDAGGPTTDALSLVDVVRGAMSSIDQYSRVTIGRVASLGVAGFAAEDISRLLAELLDNAANQSPPNAPVRVSAHLTDSGSVLLRIEDEGIGLPPERMDELNRRLSPSETDVDEVIDDEAVRSMGLTVVRRLADRHKLTVSLANRLPSGTTATVLLPLALVTEVPDAMWSGNETVFYSQGPGLVEPAPEQPERSTGAISGQLPQRVPQQTGAAATPPPPADTAARAADTTAPGADTAEPATPVEEPPSPRPRPRPSSNATGGTTASGLPRRVSQSLKDASAAGAGSGVGSSGNQEPMSAPEDVLEDPVSMEESHDRLLADLDAFSDGEQLAAENTEPDQDGEDTPRAKHRRLDDVGEESAE